jgi:hypothetical protein
VVSVTDPHGRILGFLDWPILHSRQNYGQTLSKPLVVCLLETANLAIHWPNVANKTATAILVLRRRSRATAALSKVEIPLHRQEFVHIIKPKSILAKSPEK